jgi:hypothetical protein
MPGSHIFSVQFIKPEIFLDGDRENLVNIGEVNLVHSLGKSARSMAQGMDGTIIRYALDVKSFCLVIE